MLEFTITGDPVENVAVLQENILRAIGNDLLEANSVNVVKDPNNPALTRVIINPYSDEEAKLDDADPKKPFGLTIKFGIPGLSVVKPAEDADGGQETSEASAENATSNEPTEETAFDEAEPQYNQEDKNPEEEAAPVEEEPQGECEECKVPAAEEMVESTEEKVEHVDAELVSER